MIDILACLIVFSILVLIHELGHFVAAKIIGVKVLEFGFGLPPRLIGIKRGETIYSINALPIGGFVRLYGEDEATTEDKSEPERAFYKKSVLQRLFVITAGVVMNFTLAVIIVSYIFTKGVYVPTNHVYVEKVVINSPAAQSGIKKGDQVVQIGEYEIKSTNDLIKYTNLYKGKTVSILIKRNAKTLSVKASPRVNPPAGEGALGVAVSNLEFKKYSLIEAPFAGLVETARTSILMFQGIVDVFSRLFRFAEVPKEVAGPVGIARLVGEAMKMEEWFMAVLQLMGILSLNLAVINIFPFPALDGGRLFFVLLEVVTRRKINPKFESIVNTVGLAILIGLIALVTRNDILRK